MIDTCRPWTPNYTNKGHIFYAAHEHAQALDAYEQAIEHGSQEASVYISKGRILSNLKQYKEALEDLKIAISLDTRNASAYYSKGDIHYNLKQYKEAFTSYEYFYCFDCNSNGNLLNDFKLCKDIFTAYWHATQHDIDKTYISHDKKQYSL